MRRIKNYFLECQRKKIDINRNANEGLSLFSFIDIQENTMNLSEQSVVSRIFSGEYAKENTILNIFY